MEKEETEQKNKYKISSPSKNTKIFFDAYSSAPRSP